MYCDIARPPSRALGAAPKHAATSASDAQAIRQLGQVLKPLNDDLDVLPRRHRREAEEIQVHPDAFAAGRRHAGRELVLRDGRSIGTCAASGSERRPSGLPPQRVGQRSGGRREPRDVRRHVIRLDDVLRVEDLGIAPLADFDVEFAVILLGRCDTSLTVKTYVP